MFKHGHLGEVPGTQISPPQPSSACWVVIRNHHSLFWSHFLQPLIKVITFQNQQQGHAFQWLMFGLVWNSWPAVPWSWGDLQTARSAASCVGWHYQQMISIPSLKYAAIFQLSTDTKANEEQRPWGTWPCVDLKERGHQTDALLPLPQVPAYNSIFLHLEMSTFHLYPRHSSNVTFSSWVSLPHANCNPPFSMEEEKSM